ncbi:hypothetical protein A1507_06335 [Methylomonas koyamae]|uniref:Cytochrome P460 domain-containing protein n=1 Tax=Methylomonas koyamae TaxID=702114 RepID=A0A177NNZ9_9GAMM|nr:cytochrome P460 family protein [Methylomonas koyamae]OAI19777.1 hypothetical protein A1507_06335 [Methylomonas koyamae]
MKRRFVFSVVLAAASAPGFAADSLAATFGSVVSANGSSQLPQAVRGRWQHLGSWQVADPNAPGHGFHDVYTQPEAAAYYRRHGRFPDGAVLVKEIRAIRHAQLTTGAADYAGDAKVWFVMVKDAIGRFAGHRDWEDGRGQSFRLSDLLGESGTGAAGKPGRCRRCLRYYSARSGCFR